MQIQTKKHLKLRSHKDHTLTPKKKKLIIWIGVITVITVALGGYVFAINNNTPSNNIQPAAKSSNKPNSKTSTQSDENKSNSSENQTEAPQSGDSDGTSSSENSASGSSNYDPHKCDSLKAEADRLKNLAAQKQVVYENAINNAETYGDFYNQARSQYGSAEAAKIIADQQSSEQQSHIEQLGRDWKNTLDASTTAYSKFQQCEGANLTSQ